MEKYLVIWPKSKDVVHINYHYTQFGECVDYLNKFFQNQLVALDCDVQNEDVLELIESNNIQKVVMQINYENAENAFLLCEKIKEKYSIPIMGYGSIPIRLPEMFFNSKFDVIFKNGDPEVCIRTFFKSYDEKKDIQELQKSLLGANIIRDGKFIETEQGKYISPNSWGVSKQEFVPVDKYDELKGKNRFVLNISRGCPYGCPHCLIQLTEGRKERRRSIDNLREALKQIEKKYKHIKIWAANFTLDKEYVKEFCKLMREEYPDITWECATRIDLVRDIEMLKEMYEAGCRQISLGIESLNNEELIHTKGFEIQEISRAIDGIQSVGIRVKGCIMLGMPNQDKESIVQTLKFLKEKNVTIRPTIYTPYQKITPDVGLQELEKYNRKTYENSGIDGVTSEQLIQLVKNPYNYEEILQIEKEKDEEER